MPGVDDKAEKYGLTTKLPEGIEELQKNIEKSRYETADSLTPKHLKGGQGTLNSGKSVFVGNETKVLTSGKERR